jgi:hypothetical protein
LRDTPLRPADIRFPENVPLFNPVEPVVRGSTKNEVADLPPVLRASAIFKEVPNRNEDFVPEPNAMQPGDIPKTPDSILPGNMAQAAASIVNQVSTGQTPSVPGNETSSSGSPGSSGSGSSGNGGSGGFITPPGIGGGGPIGNGGSTDGQPGASGGSTGGPPGGSGGGTEGGGQNPPPGDTGTPGSGGDVTPAVIPEGDALALFVAGLAPILILLRRRTVTRNS